MAKKDFHFILTNKDDDDDNDDDVQRR